MKKKLLGLALILSLAMSILTVNASAYSAIPAEISSSLTTMLSDGFNGLVDDLLTVLAVAVPAVFGVIGIFFVIRKVIGFFQKSTGKS